MLHGDTCKISSFVFWNTECFEISREGDQLVLSVVEQWLAKTHCHLVVEKMSWWQIFRNIYHICIQGWGEQFKRDWSTQSDWLVVWSRNQPSIWWPVEGMNPEPRLARTIYLIVWKACNELLNSDQGIYIILYHS